MENCIFCQIVAGKSPSYRVYEDQDFLGLLDIHPRVKGHTLVIPKKHYQWVYEVPMFEEYWQAVLKITKAILKSLKPVYIHYFTYGFHVSHAHIHIFPHYEEIGQEKSDLSEKKVGKNEMEQIASKIMQEVVH